MGLISKELRINDDIRVREVRVIDSAGEQVGVMPTKDALKRSGEKQLDLVEVAPNAKPPVCRIMDYGKYLYEESKKKKKAKKNQTITTLKEIRMTPKIDDHDFDVKINKVKKFLQNGDKVKVSIRFRGREIVHRQIGESRLKEAADMVKEFGKVSGRAKLEGRNMNITILPKDSEK